MVGLSEYSLDLDGAQILVVPFHSVWDSDPLGQVLFVVVFPRGETRR